MNYFFHCPCGHKLTVSRSQSGMQTPCVCGRSVAVPSLSKLSREQSQPEPQRTAPVEFQVRGPASWLMGISAFSVICLVALIAFNLLAILRLDAPDAAVMGQSTSNRETVLLRLIIEVGLLVVHAMIFFGAYSMSRMRNFGFARAAAMLAVLPGISPCVVLGIPIALSALSTLGRPEVKAAFK